MSDDSENALVEQPAIALFASLGYETANGFHERFGGVSLTFGRETTAEVILTLRLRTALERSAQSRRGTRGHQRGDRGVEPGPWGHEPGAGQP